jgi:hypothetical protein
VLESRTFVGLAFGAEVAAFVLGQVVLGEVAHGGIYEMPFGAPVLGNGNFLVEEGRFGDELARARRVCDEAH